MKKNLVWNVMGCLMFALALAGCGQGGWKDTGVKCVEADWKKAKWDYSDLAKQYQKSCDKGNASDLRCKGTSVEVQCK